MNRTDELNQALIGIALSPLLKFRCSWCGEGFPFLTEPKATFCEKCGNVSQADELARIAEGKPLFDEAYNGSLTVKALKRS